MVKFISVIICTHNPRLNFLEKVLNGLKAQTLPVNNWELLIIDNASTDKKVLNSVDLSWHFNAKVMEEKKLGVIWARISGINNSRGEHLIFIDDDNVIFSNYLQDVCHIFEQFPKLGAIGGKSLPEFEIEPESWVREFFDKLALRDLGNQEQTFFFDTPVVEQKKYPLCAPIGAGMAVRKEAVQPYVKRISAHKAHQIFDRKGESLFSGGDNDMVLSVLESGWGVGYFPPLGLTHIIPKERLDKNYLGRLNRGIMASWPIVLALYGICPWDKISRWTVQLRQIKAYFTCRAWAGPAQYVRWQGACGLFEGLSWLSKIENPL